jgi:hypothetical protein
MALVSARNIKGLIPAVDRKKIGEPFLVDAKNVLVDINGPRAAFGHECSNDKFNPLQFMQDFKVKDTIFYFSRDVTETFIQISEMSWVNRQLQHVLTLQSADLLRPKLNHPWTHALVGGLHYFANRTWGVLQYNPSTKTWTDVTATIGVSDIFFITEANGRLCTLADGFTTWSAIDNGMDSAPSLVTGAGAQNISLIGSIEQNSDYLGIAKTSKGFISFTSKGVLRSESIDSINPFRHIPGQAKHVPFSPWGIAKISDVEVAILTSQGLFKTNTGIFEDWHGLMGQFFKRDVMPLLPAGQDGFICIRYSLELDQFFVMFSQNIAASRYNVTYVLDITSDQWGIFNKAHRGFLRIDLGTGNTDIHFGYVDDNGRICLFTESATSFTIQAADDFGVYNEKLLQPEPWYLGAAALLGTAVRVSGFSTKQFPETAGYYEELGVRESFKTNKTCEIKTILASSAHLDDTDVISPAFRRSSFAAIPQTAGKTLRAEFTFVQDTSINIAVRLNVGPVILVLRSDFVSVTHFFAASAGIDILSSGAVKIWMEWVTDAVFDSVHSVMIFPTRDIVGSETGAVHLLKMTVFDTAIPAVEILTSIDVFDAANWFTGGSLLLTAQDLILSSYEEQAVFPTCISTNHEICVLGPTRQDLTLESLDSFAEIGLFRFTDEENANRLSLISNVVIGTLDNSETLADISEDWLNDFAVDVFEDWLTISPDVFEDWGEGAITGSRYTQQIRGTLDGYRTFQDQFQELPEALFDGKSKFCSSNSNGLYQTILINALGVSESYHVKTLELSGAITGVV